MFWAANGLSANSPRRRRCSARAFSGASSRQPCLRPPHYRRRLRAAAPIPAAALRTKQTAISQLYYRKNLPVIVVTHTGIYYGFYWSMSQFAQKCKKHNPLPFLLILKHQKFPGNIMPAKQKCINFRLTNRLNRKVRIKINILHNISCITSVILLSECAFLFFVKNNINTMTTICQK